MSIPSLSSNDLTNNYSSLTSMLGTSSTDTSSSTDSTSLLSSLTGGDSSSSHESADFLHSVYYVDTYGIDPTAEAGSISTYLNDVKKNSGDLLSSVNSLSKAKTADDKINYIKNVVSNYNKLLDTTTDISDSGAASLAKQLKDVSSTYKDSLSGIGISINDDGSLSLDENTLKKASANGDLDDFLTANGDLGKSYGFLSDLQNVSQSANEDPTYYLSNSGKKSNITGTDTSSVSFLDNYYKVYSEYTTVGNLLDSIS